MLSFEEPLSEWKIYVASKSEWEKYLTVKK